MMAKTLDRVRIAVQRTVKALVRWLNRDGNVSFVVITVVFFPLVVIFLMIVGAWWLWDRGWRYLSRWADVSD